MDRHTSDPDRQRSADPPPVAPRRSAFETVTQTIAGLSGLVIMALVATPIALCLLIVAFIISGR